MKVPKFAPLSRSFSTYFLNTGSKKKSQNLGLEGKNFTAPLERKILSRLRLSYDIHGTWTTCYEAATARRRFNLQLFPKTCTKWNDLVKLQHGILCFVANYCNLLQKRPNVAPGIRGIFLRLYCNGSTSMRYDRDRYIYIGDAAGFHFPSPTAAFRDYERLRLTVNTFCSL